MKPILLFLVILFAYNTILDVHGQFETIKRCYGHTCPQNTTFCLKIVNTTDDDLEVTIEVNCLDENFTTLATFNGTRANPFGPVLSIQGVSFSSVDEVPVLPYHTSTTSTSTTSDADTNGTSTPRTG